MVFGTQLSLSRVNFINGSSKQHSHSVLGPGLDEQDKNTQEQSVRRMGQKALLAISLGVVFAAPTKTTVTETEAQFCLNA